MKSEICVSVYELVESLWFEQCMDFNVKIRTVLE